MKRTWRTLPDEVLYSVCENILYGQGATEIARRLTDKGFPCTREQVYPLLQQGIRRNFLRLCPPENIELSRQLARKSAGYGLPPVEIKVLGTTGPNAFHQIAMAAADLMLSLIQEVGRKKATVHIGLGGGQHTREIARGLAALLQAQSPHDFPALVFHALSSGFNVSDPATSPLTFFSYFTNLRIKTEYVGVFTSPFVASKDYEKTKKLPLVSEAFEKAKEIDIVVTSLGAPRDQCTLFNRVLLKLEPKARRKLEEAGWVGDIQWQPYSNTRLIDLKTRLRAIGVLGFPEFVQMAATPGKCVVGVTGPCQTCGQTRAGALAPLLKQPNLRVFNYLVLDIGTAEEVAKSFG